MSKTVFDTIDPVILDRVRAMRFFDDEFMSYVYKEIQKKIYELTSPKEIEEENKDANN